jgi:hypothetical protein
MWGCLLANHDWKVIENELRKRFAGVGDRVAKNFLKREAPILESRIAEKFYTRGGDGVNVRTGTARRSWKTLFPTSNKAVIVNTAPYADFTKEKVIRPKKAKALAIPIGKALTPSGVPRFNGPRDPGLPDLTYIKPKGKNPLLVAIGKNGKMQAYFVLVKQVTIPAHTRGLPAFVEREGIQIKRRFIPVLRKALGE